MFFKTLPSKGHGFSADSVNHQSPPLSAMDLLSIPMMRALTFSGFTLAFIGTAYDVVFVLFLYTPIERGGLSFSASPLRNHLEWITEALKFIGKRDRICPCNERRHFSYAPALRDAHLVENVSHLHDLSHINELLAAHLHSHSIP
jgi:hypothetical protein